MSVGDVIRMEDDHFVAADLLLISTSEPSGLCYIETSELDGETNLKCRQCLSETALLGDDNSKIGAFDAEIICEAPNNRLNKFEGTLIWNNQKWVEKFFLPKNKFICLHFRFDNHWFSD